MIARPSTRSRNGFTLVELSIVIAIVALLTGGIIAGKSVIKAGQLRSLITDANKYNAAIAAFRDQYKGLPGDIVNATNYWGAAATYQTDTTGSTLTMNGNGDGMVDPGYYANYACTATGFTNLWEGVRAWKQLANAELIKGNFSDRGFTSGFGTFAIILGKAVPATRVANVGFGFLNADYWFTKTTGGATTFMYTSNYQNALFLGTNKPASPSSCSLRDPMYAAFTPEQAASMDTKTDDGLPGTGNWIASLASSVATNVFGNAAACTTSANTTDYSGVYNVSQTAQLCSFIIKTGF